MAEEVPTSFFFLPPVGPTERCGCLHDVLTLIPASSGLWNGFTWNEYRMLSGGVEWGVELAE